MYIIAEKTGSSIGAILHNAALSFELVRYTTKPWQYHSGRQVVYLKAFRQIQPKTMPHT
jgi:hypothetical protein